VCQLRPFESLAVVPGIGVLVVTEWQRKSVCMHCAISGGRTCPKKRGRLEEFHTAYLRGGKQRNVALDAISETRSPVGLSVKPRLASHPKAEESRWSDIHQTGMGAEHWSTTVSYPVMELPDTAYLPPFTTIMLLCLPPKTIPVMSGQERISGHV